MARSISIRIATVDDAAAVREIYAPFCESSAVTFEEEPPSVSELENRIQTTLETYPWLVCEITEEQKTADNISNSFDYDEGLSDTQKSNEVVGYAYADSLRKRAAYQWVAELSVYVKDGHRSSGVGKALYSSLFKLLKEQGIRDAYAVTTLPNSATVAFHEQLGFERLVDFPAMGFTEGEWHDVAWWCIHLTEKESNPEPVVPFAALDEQQISSLIEYQ